MDIDTKVRPPSPEKTSSAEASPKKKPKLNTESDSDEENEIPEEQSHSKPQREEEQEQEQEQEEEQEDEEERPYKYPYNKQLGTLEELLRAAKTSSKPQSSGSREIMMPGISVEGVGRISFPVPEGQWGKLAAKARENMTWPAESVVGDIAGNVWRIAPEILEISGDSWKSTLKFILKKVFHSFFQLKK